MACNLAIVPRIALARPGVTVLNGPLQEHLRNGQLLPALRHVVIGKLVDLSLDVGIEVVWHWWLLLCDNALGGEQVPATCFR